jgi:hypothetical protein
MMSEDMTVMEQGYGLDVGKFCQFVTQFVAGICMSFSRSWQVLTAGIHAACLYLF